MPRAREACATVSMSVWVDPESANRLCYEQASETNEKRRLRGARVQAVSVLRAALRAAPADDAVLLAQHAALLASVGAGGCAQVLLVHAILLLLAMISDAAIAAQCEMGNVRDMVAVLSVCCKEKTFALDRSLEIPARTDGKSKCILQKAKVSQDHPVHDLPVPRR